MVQFISALSGSHPDGNIAEVRKRPESRGKGQKKKILAIKSNDRPKGRGPEPKELVG
jgi:hypothetical protein